MFSPDYSKRDYLLPEGCKDLIDVIRLHATQEPQAAFHAGYSSNPTPTLKGDILLPEKTTVGELSAMLRQKPFKIIADAMELGVFANVNQNLDFEIMSQIARKYRGSTDSQHGERGRQDSSGAISAR